MSSVIVQIYTMQSVDEALAVADLGVDHVGVTPSDRGLPGEVSLALAANICAAVEGHAKSVALSVETDLDAIEGMVRQVRPDIVHLCGPSNALSPLAVTELRRRFPNTSLMQAIAVTGPESIVQAAAYATVVDYLILDSVDPTIAGIGAAGRVHDWVVSAEIVDSVDIPVVLAGGLSPDNVAEAISAVHPWGVDSLTHTNRRLDSGGFRKDLLQVRRFVEQARGVEPSDG